MICINTSILNIFKNFSLNKIVSSTSSTLNVIKKIIPVYKEVRPFFNREKTIFNNNEIKKESNNESKYDDSLTFFQ